jgi:hypothetical protein
MILLVFVVARNFPSDEASVRSSSVPPTAPAIGSAGAAAAAGATATPSPTASATGETPLRSAIGTLTLLTQAIRDGDLSQVPGLVRKLVAERAVAAAAGADVTRLNELIGERLAPLTHGLEPRTGWALRYNLGALVPPPDTTGTDPSEPGPSNEEPRPDPTTSPPPADGTEDTTTPPPTDSGTDPGSNDGSTEDPDSGAQPPSEEARDETDSNVGNNLPSDQDPNSSNVDSTQDRSNAPAADGGPTAESDGGADDRGGEPSDEPIASTGPSASTGGDRETTNGDDSPDDGDGDAAADGS